MTTGTADEIRAFIADEILYGQADGLSAETPLLELGILDSFALLKLVAHLNETHGVDIGPEHISGRDFANVGAIAALVQRHRTETPRPRAHACENPPPEGVVVFEAPACAQLFVVFTGQGCDAGNSAEFFRESGLEQRNIIVMHDGRNESYRAGVSAQLPTPAAVCRWLGQWIERRPHLIEVYCLGASSGGPMALVAGHLLKAKTVWAFGARTARARLDQALVAELAQLAWQTTGKRLADLREHVTDTDRELLDAAITPALIADYNRRLLDPALVLDFEHLETVASLLSSAAGTEYRLFYVARNACDAHVVDRLRSCPQVHPIAVEPSDPPPPDWPFARWLPPPVWVCRDHLVLDLLRQRGEVRGLFPEYRPSAVETRA